MSRPLPQVDPRARRCPKWELGAPSPFSSHAAARGGVPTLWEDSPGWARQSPQTEGRVWSPLILRAQPSRRARFGSEATLLAQCSGLLSSQPEQGAPQQACLRGQARARHTLRGASGPFQPCVSLRETPSTSALGSPLGSQQALTAPL